MGEEEIIDVEELEELSTKHTVRCPHCGGEVPTRAKLGQGTQKGKDMKMNQNRQRIVDVLIESGKPLSVRDVQQRIFDKQIKRISKRGTGWNYHVVQADLSILVGMGSVEMIRPYEHEIWNEQDGHTTKGIPLYKVKRLVGVK